MKVHELPPNAGRVINSLRDAGYDFNTAVADVVDNSIAAGATKVSISAECDEHNGEISVAIADNGCGMTFKALCNAMTYGSAERSDVHSLGKFGLGLKTASTSQCRRVSLISRACEDGPIHKLVLDIDHAAKTNRWEYLEETPTRADLILLRFVAGDDSGTVVKWEKCDRILTREYKEPGGRNQQNAFSKKLDQLRFHLGLVFQRFIDPNFADAPTVRIELNDRVIKAWNPFCTEMSETTRMPHARTGIATKQGKSYVDIDAYVIPSRDEVDSITADRIFPAGTNPDRFQGIYVYRENRLIHWGDWCGIYKTEFHQRLCRVSVSFDATLDRLFQVDFKKSRIEINTRLADWMKSKVLEEARAKADKRYRKGTVTSSMKEATTLHAGANKSIENKTDVKEHKYFVQQLPNGVLRVENSHGTSFVKGKVENEAAAGENSKVRAVESLDNGLLWEPGIYRDGSGHMMTYVKLNTSHPYYQKVYKACRDNPNAVKALDYLLYSLADAEYSTTDEEAAENYEDMRIDVSRNLSKLVSDMAE